MGTRIEPLPVYLSQPTPPASPSTPSCLPTVNRRLVACRSTAYWNSSPSSTLPYVIVGMSRRITLTATPGSGPVSFTIPTRTPYPSPSATSPIRRAPSVHGKAVDRRRGEQLSPSRGHRWPAAPTATRHRGQRPPRCSGAGAKTLSPAGTVVPLPSYERSGSTISIALTRGVMKKRPGAPSGPPLPMTGLPPLTRPPSSG